MFGYDHSNPVLLLALINLAITVLLNFSYRKEGGQITRSHTFYINFLATLNVIFALIILSFYIFLRSKIYFRMGFKEIKYENEKNSKANFKIFV